MPRLGSLELITGRLMKLAKSVARRSLENVSDGLSGAVCIDEIDTTGKCRTPTGLRHPSKTDNAQAWCALFGVSAFPVAKSTVLQEKMTAAICDDEKRQSYAVLPLWDKPWSIQRYRAVVRSRELLFVASSYLGNDFTKTITGVGKSFLQSGIQDSELWLRSKGVRLCVLFPQYSTLTKSPENWLQKGELIYLNAEG